MEEYHQSVRDEIAIRHGSPILPVNPYIVSWEESSVGSEKRAFVAQTVKHGIDKWLKILRLAYDKETHRIKTGTQALEKYDQEIFDNIIYYLSLQGTTLTLMAKKAPLPFNKNEHLDLLADIFVNTYLQARAKWEASKEGLEAARFAIIAQILLVEAYLQSGIYAGEIKEDGWFEKFKNILTSKRATAQNVRYFWERVQLRWENLNPSETGGIAIDTRHLDETALQISQHLASMGKTYFANGMTDLNFMMRHWRFAVVSDSVRRNSVKMEFLNYCPYALERLK